MSMTRWCAVIALVLGLFASGCGHKRSAIEIELEKSASGAVEQILNNDVTLFTADASFVNFTTKETIQGADAIVSWCQDELKSNPQARVSVIIDKVLVKDLLNAVVTATMSVMDERVAIRAEYVKDAGKWLIKKVQSVVIEQAPTHYAHLKELEWLIGSWTNNGDAVLMTSKYRWGTNKNFIIEKFTLKILGQKELKGRQIIGWDPVRKQIVSWVFDSDGGYGHSSWIKGDDSWYVRTVFILSDGRKAVATHSYKKVDDSTYTFSSEGRDIDGHVQPNIGPFKAVRTEKGNV